MSTANAESTPGSSVIGETPRTIQDVKECVSFVTACPPDVDSRTRIIAVCGLTDDGGQASPTEDGWLLSDFYLFHYLFSRHQPTACQVWMTCEEPQELARKYGEYTHGDRVVLDNDIVQDIGQSGSLRIISEDDLRERFLSTLREESLLAKEGEHLVVLIFGHGDPGTFGVVIGEDKQRLTIENVQQAVHPGTPITLFMTSCFSGGWIVQSNAAGADTTSHSWPVNSSLGRACGSMIASAFFRTSIDLEEYRKNTAIRPEYPYNFTHSIYQSYEKLDQFVDEREIHFSAQDDQWEYYFKCRGGTPRSQLKARWESLRLVPKGLDVDEDLDSTRLTAGRLRKRSKVKQAARFYYHHANPGPDNACSNIGPHGRIINLLNGRENFGVKYTDQEITSMWKTLRYRFDALAQANELAMIMRVANEDFDAYSFNSEWRQRSREERGLESVAWRLLIHDDIVDRPVGAHDWPKPYKFLSTCFATSGLDYDEMQRRVKMAMEYKYKQAEAISKLYSQILEDEKVIRQRDELLEKIKSLEAEPESEVDPEVDPED